MNWRLFESINAHVHEKKFFDKDVVVIVNRNFDAPMRVTDLCLGHALCIRIKNKIGLRPRENSLGLTSFVLN